MNCNEIIIRMNKRGLYKNKLVNDYKGKVDKSLPFITDSCFVLSGMCLIGLGLGESCGRNFSGGFCSILNSVVSRVGISSSS